MSNGSVDICFQTIRKLSYQPISYINIQFLIYDRGSCGELRTQIYIGLDIGYIENEMASNWIHETKEISTMIVGLMKSKKY